MAAELVPVAAALKSMKRSNSGVTWIRQRHVTAFLAAILVIVFGQHIEDVIQLTWNDVTVTDDVVTVRLGKTEFALPSPLDEPMRQLAAAPGNDLTASHPNSNWVFRGYSPGRHMHGSSLRSRLKTVFSTRAARLGTLHE